MNVTLSALPETETCTWCERSKECVTATFDNGFIQSEPLCWSCLKNAVKVQSRKNNLRKSKDRPRSVMRRPQLWEKFTGTTFEPRNHRYTSLVNAVALHVDELVEQLRTQQQQLVLSTERKEAVPQPPRQDDAHLLVE